MERHVSDMHDTLFRPWDSEKEREEKDGKIINKQPTQESYQPSPIVQQCSDQSRQKLRKTEKQQSKRDEHLFSSILSPHPSDYTHPPPPLSHLPPSPLSIAMRDMQHMMCPPQMTSLI